VCAFESRVREAAADDISGRDIRVMRAVLLCAVARAHLGDQTEADNLVELAGRLAGRVATDRDDRTIVPHVRLALARGDLDRVRELMARAPRRMKLWWTWWALDLEVTRLDALAALDDAAALEDEAPPHLNTCAFLDAVARRALGAVRRDAGLLDAATAAFARMDLPAQVDQTRAVGRRPSLL
jgi:hypothetical protein